jgi:endonuclease YncB( thermonuclease family)
MYGKFKLKKLWISDSGAAWATIDGEGITRTSQLYPGSMCGDFSDMLIRLGIYTPEALTFNKEKFPDELIGIEVEASIDGPYTNTGGPPPVNRITSIELTPSAHVTVEKYLNAAYRIIDKYSRDDVVYQERPGGNGSVTQNGKAYFDGTVVGVYDGDTIYVKPTGLNPNMNGIALNLEDSQYGPCVRVRLTGINCPETSKDYTVNDDAGSSQWGNKYHMSEEDIAKLSAESTKVAKELLLAKEVTVYVDTYNSGYGPGRDKYGRYLGIVYAKSPIDGTWINFNITMLQKGLAEPYVFTKSDGTVMSDFSISAWGTYSPYTEHSDSLSEKSAQGVLAEEKIKQANKDAAGKLDYTPEARRVNTLYNYQPNKSRGETPAVLASIYGCTVDELLAINNIPRSILNDLDGSGWWDMKITIPVYDKVEDFYNIDVNDVYSSDDRNNENFPEPDFNRIPSGQMDDKVRIPDPRSEYSLKIGDSEFVIPPLAIKVIESSQSQTLLPLRSKSSIKTQSGYSNKIVEVQLFFHNIESINGYAIENPDPNASDRHYYVDGLRPLIAQFKKAPLLPVWNERLHSLGIWSAGLKSIRVETVPGFPGVLSAVVQLVPFNHIPYMPQFEVFSDAFNWPVYRWYYQQSMQPLSTSSRISHTYLKPVTNNSATVEFSIADETELTTRMDYLKKLRTMATPAEYARQNASKLTKGYQDDSNELKIGQKQRQLYIQNGYDKLKPEDRERPEKVREICSKIYGASEPRVYIFPGYNVYGDNNYEEQNFWNWFNDTAKDVILKNSKNSARDYYLLQPRSKEIIGLIEKYRIVVSDVYTANIPVVMTNPHVLPIADTFTMAKIFEVTQQNEKDIDQYTKKYNEIESIVYGMESEVPMVDQAIDNLTIVDMSISYENMFVPIQVQLEQEPSLQHMGGQDIVISLHAQTNDKNTLAQVARLFAESQRMTREYRIAIVSGFLGFKNQIAGLFGVDAVLFDSFEVNTVPNQPDLIDMRIGLVGFNKQQKKSELIDKTEGINTEGVKDKYDLKTAGPIDSFGYEPVILEQKMRQLELYPDLELPTYAELNRAIPYLNAGIKQYANPNKSRFVDPDFYIGYNQTYRDTLIKSMTDIDNGDAVIEFKDDAGCGARLKVPKPGEQITAPEYDGNAMEFYSKIKDEFDFKPSGYQEGNITDPKDYGSDLSVDVPSASGGGGGFQYRKVERKETPWTGNHDAFIKFVASFAKDARSSHILPSLVIAIAIQETAYGATCVNYNLGNIMCYPDSKNPPKRGQNGWNGTYFARRAGGYARAYSSYKDAIMNLIYLLATESRYSPVRNAASYREATQAIVTTGYNPDPAYTNQLNDKIKKHNLTQYDEAVTYNPDSDKPSGPSADNIAINSLLTDKFKESPEWQKAVSEGICYTQFEDFVVNSIDPDKFKSPNLYNGTLKIDGKAYNTSPSRIDDLLTKWMNAQLNYGKCLELYDVQTGSDGKITVLARKRDKSDFEGKYWVHYPVGYHPDPAKTASIGPGSGMGQNETVKGMLYDMCQYDKRGRLIRAYPSFQMLLIDEGRWMSWYKMWDNFYGFNSILSIDVMKSRKMAADTCVMTMSNIYSNITQKDVEGKYDEGDWKWWNLFNLPDPGALQNAWDIMLGKPTDEIIAARKEAVHQLALKPGARVHLKMGYGADAYELPTVFNGVITECDVQEMVTIVAQGDGIELAHKIPDVEKNDTNDPGIFQGIYEPRDYICHLLTEYGGAWKVFFNMMLHMNQYDPNDNLCNIAHFGQSGWLPPATHSTAQELARKGIGLFSGKFIELFAPQYKDKISQLLETSRGESSYLIDVFGLPWDDYGEPGINIYRSAGIQTFSEKYYSNPGTDSNGNPVGAGSEMETKGEGIFGKMWYGLLDIFTDGTHSKVGDEPNIELYLYDRSVWDVTNTFAKCVPDYIAAVLPFELRSTLFFGKPHWGVAWKYNYKYVFNPDNSQIISMVENAPRKPYMQLHTYYSFTDIISNKIRASADNVYTNVIVTYPTDGGPNPDTKAKNEKSQIVHADTDIYPEFQKTAIVNVDFKKDREDSDGIHYSEHAGVNILKDFLKDMYDGELLVIGDPSLKPHDMIYIQDDYVDMQGYMGVKEVVHHMSFDTGFVTSIKPDCIVEGETRDVVNIMSWVSPVLVGPGLTWVTLYSANTAWRKFLSIPISKELTIGSGSSAVLGKLVMKILGTSSLAQTKEGMEVLSRLGGALFAKEAPDWALAKTILSNSDEVAKLKNMKNMAKVIDTANDIVDAAKMGKVAGTVGHIGYSVASFVKAIGYSTIIYAAIDVAITIIAHNVLEAWGRKLRNRQACVVVPVKYQGLPFTAGINGSKGLILGSQPSVYDKWLSDSNFMKTITTILGVEVPDYSNGQGD